VGDYAQGGIVFYVDESGRHGLVAATNDLETSFSWGCEGQSINGAGYLALSTGYFNSQDIMGFCHEEDIAARACDIYKNDGYDDWYLPSIDELIEMNYSIGLFSQIDNIAAFDTSTNSPSHISSSEASPSSCYSYQTEFDNPNRNFPKSWSAKVRPIRSF
ncbi:hypothetical protein N9Y06_04980, partial [Flavobacteriales bacterium]|nr:hypothetical protein [Flavobacteriales bacterium]